MLPALTLTLTLIQKPVKLILGLSASLEYLNLCYLHWYTQTPPTVCQAQAALAVIITHKKGVWFYVGQALTQFVCVWCLARVANISSDPEPKVFMILL